MQSQKMGLQMTGFSENWQNLCGKVDVEEIEAAIKEISDNIAEFLKRTPPDMSKET